MTGVRFPDRVRQRVLLAVLSGRSYAEIADEFEMSTRLVGRELKGLELVSSSVWDDVRGLSRRVRARRSFGQVPELSDCSTDRRSPIRSGSRL